MTTVMTAASEIHNFYGEVTSVRFAAKDSGFCIFSVNDKSLGSITLKGSTPPISKGVTVSGSGKLFVDPKWGKQIEIKAINVEQPQTAKAIVAYLSENIEGIGPKTAKVIVAHFGEKTLEIIRNQPHRIREVNGIGAKRAEAISEKARELIHIEKIVTFLMSHGLTSNLAFRIFKEYGERAIEAIKENPWILAAEVHGVGFQTADRVAHSMGMTGAHPGRIEAALIYVLRQNEQEGHTAMRVTKTLQAAGALTQLAPSLPAFQEGLGILASKGQLSDFEVTDKNGDKHELIQRTPTARNEHQLAETLRTMMREATLPWNPSVLWGVIQKEVDKLPWTPSEDQMEALRLMAHNPVCILTAGPGCGKTTLIGIMLQVLQEHFPEVDITLCAPTGKAAQRATESTGNRVVGATTHKLLGSDPSGRFLHNKENPLPFDYIVADESSMYDVRLAGSLVAALKSGAALIWVGDIDQLPSVGSGAVLHDMIRSRVIPVARLHTIHRQAKGSKIVVNAHAVNRGAVREVLAGHDFEIHPVMTSNDVKFRTGFLVEKFLSEGDYTVDDIMVLTAGHRSESGTIEMNQHLKSILNPTPAKSLEYGKMTFSVGDKVLVTKNNYDLDIRNGMVGRILDITDDHDVLADIEGAQVLLPKKQLSDLTLGYCMTIHKSQGSQSPLVLLACDKAHFMLLERSLLYTGITRAAKHCVVVTREDSLAIAINTKKSRQRLTTLAFRLAA